MLSRRNIRPLRSHRAPRAGWIAPLALAFAAAFLFFARGAAGEPASRTGLPAPGDATPGASVFVEGVSLKGDAKRTLLEIDLSSGVTAEIVTLANPYRVVVDLPGVSFRLPSGTGASGSGLVAAFRYGLFKEGNSRIVLDATGPVRVEKAGMENAGAGSGVRLSVSLAPMDKKAFGAGTGAARAAPKPAAPAEEPGGVEKKDRAKPVVVIDPGHGGVDPGATGSGNVLEKNIVLAVGRQLGAALASSGRYDVRLTRSTDVFVSLADRLAMSRQYDADLFISLHADAIETKAFARTVRGATVYTLSERASDELARMHAERENASDLLAGIDAAGGEEKDEVMSILLDLMKRETAEFSTDFARTLVGKLTQSISLSRDARRSAAFRVLKQTHTPSVLVELGYISHVEDEKLMTSPAWQQKVTRSIGLAIDDYFGKRLARSR